MPTWTQDDRANVNDVYECLNRLNTELRQRRDTLSPEQARAVDQMRETVIGHNHAVANDMAYQVGRPYTGTPHYVTVPGFVPTHDRGALLESMKRAFGWYDIKTPLPKVLELRKNKVLEVNKFIDKGGAKWTRADQAVLLKLHAQLKAAGATPDEEAREKMRALREKRKDRSDVQVTYKLTRGPYSEVVSTNKLYDFATLRFAYLRLRRKITHGRTQLLRLRGREGRFGVRYGLVYTTKGEVFARSQDKVKKTLYEAKSPKTKVKHIGIELEFAAKATARQITDTLYEAGLSAHVNLKGDGSVRVSKLGDHTHELCILVSEKEMKPVMMKVCQELQKLGAYVNKSCGMHVHLDMRQRPAKMCYQRLVHCLDVLYALVPPERRYNKFCLRNGPDMPYDPNRGERYYAINSASMGRHQTLEVRLHQGTLNAMKIIHWCELLMLIVDKPILTAFRSVRKFIAEVKPSERLAAYMVERMGKFNPEDGGFEQDEEHRPVVSRESADSSAKCQCEECAWRESEGSPNAYAREA